MPLGGLRSPKCSCSECAETAVARAVPDDNGDRGKVVPGPPEPGPTTVNPTPPA